jgi:ribulose-5-phosphate 4-epimerase/fuculose-1-phosphate aldolase
MAMDTVKDADEQRARRLVTASSTIQYRLGLTDYLGHTSMRLAGDARYLIKPKHSPSVRAMDSLGPDDLIVVDDDGVSADTARPPAEVFIHTEILKRRPDVNVVVHTHQPLAVTMGILEAPIHPLLHVQSPLVAEPVPIWPCSLLVTDQDLGGRLADALGDGLVAHLQGHGIVSVGATIEEATVNAIHLEQLARVNLEALKTGLTPRVIPPEQIERLRDQLAPVDGRWSYYASITDVDETLLD